jgi:hypothetical protein
MYKLLGRLVEPPERDIDLDRNIAYLRISDGSMTFLKDLGKYFASIQMVDLSEFSLEPGALEGLGAVLRADFYDLLVMRDDCPWDLFKHAVGVRLRVSRNSSIDAARLAAMPNLQYLDIIGNPRISGQLTSASLSLQSVACSGTTWRGLKRAGLQISADSVVISNLTSHSLASFRKLEAASLSISDLTLKRDDLLAFLKVESVSLSLRFDKTNFEVSSKICRAAGDLIAGVEFSQVLIDEATIRQLEALLRLRSLSFVECSFVPGLTVGLREPSALTRLEIRNMPFTQIPPTWIAPNDSLRTLVVEHAGSSFICSSLSKLEALTIVGQGKSQELRGAISGALDLRQLTLGGALGQCILKASLNAKTLRSVEFSCPP